MKIEKVNDHQIRCTLTKNDLADRELKISELAYGTDKAKSLFRDMMQQAAYEFGFEADDIPLMIEAIPLNSDCIVLIITKVEDPDELDTRFSNFAPSVNDEEEDFDSDEFDSGNLTYEEDGANEVLDLFRKLQESQQTDSSLSSMEKSSQKPAQAVAKSEVEVDSGKNITKVFMFESLNELTRVSALLANFYHGTNSLYKNQSNGTYLLVIHRDSHTPNEFNKVCNTLSEYGYLEKNGTVSVAYMDEHYDRVIANDAILSLSLIK